MVCEKPIQEYRDCRTLQDLQGTIGKRGIPSPILLHSCLFPDSSRLCTGFSAVVARTHRSYLCHGNQTLYGCCDMRSCPRAYAQLLAPCLWLCVYVPCTLSLQSLPGKLHDGCS